jgi:hypothetical protein
MIKVRPINATRWKEYAFIDCSNSEIALRREKSAHFQEQADEEQ